jgi:hypothetical protein
MYDIELEKRILRFKNRHVNLARRDFAGSAAWNEIG